MGREGTKTIAHTSVDDIYVRILDAFVEQEQKKSILSGKRKSRANTLEDAILLMVYQKGMLEQVLKELDVSDAEVQRTIQRLKVEYGIFPKP